MIHELEIRNPKRAPITHWGQVPFLKKPTTIEFKPGLNIVFGPNGSGKSTLLAGLAVLLHCYDEGWPRVSMQSLRYFQRSFGLADGVVLSHDGSPARYLGEREPGFAPVKNVKETTVQLHDKRLEYKALCNMSTGQANIAKLSRFLRVEPKKVPVSVKARTEEMRQILDVGTESLRNVTRVEGVPKQPVILLDEIDRSLDFANQSAVWGLIRKWAQNGSQIIVVSHSPFAVCAPGAHYILTTSPEYLEAARAGFQTLTELAAEVSR